MIPSLPAVCGLVNAIAGREVRATQSFAAAYINDVRIRRCQSERSDRTCWLAIKHRIPCAAEVVSLPNPAVVRRHEKDIWLIGNACDRDGASGPEWANTAPA